MLSPSTAWSDTCVYIIGTTSLLSTRRLKVLTSTLREQAIPYHSYMQKDVVDDSWQVDCLDGGRGTARLWRNNYNVWKEAQRTCAGKEWLVVLESDAILPPNFAVRAEQTFKKSASSVVWLDARDGTGSGPSPCCTVGMAYRMSILPQLIFHFDWTNTRAFWKGYAARQKAVIPGTNAKDCLFDWYLGNLAANEKIASSRSGIVAHPQSAPSELGSFEANRVDRSTKGSRILAGVATSTAQTRSLNERLKMLCTHAPGLRVVVNVFDDGDFTLDAPCILEVTRFRAHKTLFWRKYFTPVVTGPYDFVWFFDNDLVIEGSVANNMIAMMKKYNVALAQPRVTASRHGGRSSDHIEPRRDSYNEALDCIVASNFVEVMTPFFTQKAWVMIYTQLLKRFTNTSLAQSVQGIDVLWCPVLQSLLPNSPACGIAVSKSIPAVIHTDARDIDRSKHHYAKRSTGPSGNTQRGLALRYVEAGRCVKSS